MNAETQRALWAVRDKIAKSIAYAEICLDKYPEGDTSADHMFARAFFMAHRAGLQEAMKHVLTVMSNEPEEKP